MTGTPFPHGSSSFIGALRFLEWTAAGKPANAVFEENTLYFA